MAFGIYGLLANAERTNPPVWSLWFLGAAFVHDAILAPVVFLAGRALSRWIRGPARAHVQGAMIASALVALTAYPFVRGYGRRDDNLSVLPNNYAHGLAGVLVAIWLVTAALSAWGAWRKRTGRATRPGTPAAR